MSSRAQAVAVVVAAVVVAVVIGAWALVVEPQRNAEAAARSQASAGPVTTPTPSPSASPAKLPASVLKAGTKAVFFGDSWTTGYAAAPGKGFPQVAASSLGWSPVVDGASGTGYLKANGAAQPYPARAKALEPDAGVGVVVLQGGLNDQAEDLSGFKAAAESTVATLKAKYPKAALVIVGPAAPTLPAPDALYQIAQDLSDVAAAAGAPFIDPLAEQWVRSDNYGTFIDTAKANHPSTEGHAEYAKYLVEDIHTLAS